MKALARLVAAVLAFTLLAGTASGQPALYNLDVIINLTGSNAFVGATYAQSLRVLERYVNAHGGINGQPLHLEFHDDQSSPLIAVQIATQLLQKHPLAFVGGSQVADCAAVGPIAIPAGPVDFCLSPGYAPPSGSYAFASSASAQYIMVALLRFGRLKGYRHFAIIDPTDAGGQATDKLLNDAIKLPENRELTFVDQEHFTPGDLSVAAQIERIRAAKPDAIVTYASGPNFGTVLHGLHDAGIDIPMLTSAANLDPVQLQQYRSFLPAQLYFNALLYYGRDQLPRGALRDGIDGFLAAFKSSSEQLTPGSGFAWDPVWILVNAIRRLGPSATPAQLRDYLLKLHDFNGFNGSYDFRIGDQHGLTDNAIVYVQWHPDTNTFQSVSRPGGYPR
jgi:branched-chain amino acid transport system substrate-binding protein